MNSDQKPDFDHFEFVWEMIFDNKGVEFSHWVFGNYEEGETEEDIVNYMSVVRSDIESTGTFIKIIESHPHKT